MAGKAYTYQMLLRFKTSVTYKKNSLLHAGQLCRTKTVFTNVHRTWNCKAKGMMKRFDNHSHRLIISEI